MGRRSIVRVAEREPKYVAEFTIGCVAVNDARCVAVIAEHVECCGPDGSPR